MGKEIIQYHQFVYSPMYLALKSGHVEAAKILASKGADCTEQEKAALKGKYSNFQQEQQRERQAKQDKARLQEEERQKGRGEIRQWMNNHEFAKLRKWLSQCKTSVGGAFEAGEVPAVGWLELAATIQSKEVGKSWEAELEQNEKEQQRVAQKIKILQEKQEQLAKRKQELQESMKQIDEIVRLQAESQSIALLGEKEAAALGKLQKKMENPYFMEDLDFEDVSTVFSMFNMDSLFPKFKKNDIYSNLEVTANAMVEHLQKNLELNFSETVELLWKLKLLENKEKGEARHLAKCSICSSKKPGLLLAEYGMREEDRKEIEGKMSGWKGFYFATVNPASAALELNLTAALTQKLTTCWLRIQRVHKWEHPDD